MSRKSTKKPIGCQFYDAPNVGLSIFGTTFSGLFLIFMSFNGLSKVSMNEMGFSEAIRKTLISNPELKSFEYQYDASIGRVMYSKLISRPIVNLSLEDFAGTNEVSGVKNLQSTLSVSWVLENDLILSRTALAESSKGVIQSNHKIKQLEVANETARIFVRTLAQQSQIKIIQQAIEFSKIFVREIKKRVTAGKTNSAELLRAEAELAKQNLILDDLKHEVQISYRRLSVQWGEVNLTFDSVVGELHIDDKPKEFDWLVAKLQQNLQIEKYKSQEQIYQAKIRLASAENKPRWKFMTGLRRYESTDDFGLVAGFSIPFGKKNRAQGRISEITAEIASNNTDLESLKISLQASLFSYHQMMLHNIHLTEALNLDIIPKLLKAKKKTYAAYIVGQYTYMDLKNVQDDLIDAQLTLLEARLNFNLNKIEIESLIGSQLQSQLHSDSEEKEL